jgi:cell division protein FtsA
VASSSCAGWAVAPSNGLKRGVVVNIDATVHSIQQALKEAELMADCKITRVYTGITGSHIRGINSSGMVAIKDKEVTPADVARVLERRAPSTSPPTSGCCWWSRRSS